MKERTPVLKNPYVDFSVDVEKRKMPAGTVMRAAISDVPAIVFCTCVYIITLLTPTLSSSHCYLILELRTPNNYNRILSNLSEITQ